MKMSVERLTQHPKHGTKDVGSDGRSRLRNWVTPSYSDDGRAAPSSVPETNSWAFDKGEGYRKTGQFDAAMTTFKARDARCTTEKTNIGRREYTRKVER